MTAPRAFRKHQRDAFRYALSVDHPALFMEMRLGKTLVCLRRLAMRAPRSPARGLRVLVVAPGSALGSWEREAALEGWDSTTLRATKKIRRAALRSAFLPARGCACGDARAGTRARARRALYLLNKEAWRVVPEIGDDALCPWDAVVVDESTSLKNPAAKVTRFFLKAFRKTPSRWILTGTPCPEGEEEYFCQIAFLRGGAFGFTSFWGFRQHYMEPDPRGYGWHLKPGAADHLRRVVGQTCLVMRRKDVGMDRVKIRERREIEMPESIRATYNKMELEMTSAATGTDAQFTKWWPVTWGWMRQLCGGFLQGSLAWRGKIDALLELLRGELARDQVVVWCSYNAEVHLVRDELTRLGIPSAWWTGVVPPAVRETRRKLFANGRYRVLVVQEATAQTGMDLSAADAAIYYSTPAGAMARSQTEDRILSLSKHGPLLYVDLVVKASVDEDVLAQLERKAATSDLSLSRALFAAARARAQGAKP